MSQNLLLNPDLLKAATTHPHRVTCFTPLNSDGQQYYTTDDYGNLTRPDGWSLWCVHAREARHAWDPGNKLGWVVPEVKLTEALFNADGSLQKMVYPERWYQGARSIAFFNTWKTSCGGLAQSVQVTPGKTYRFQMYAHAWDSNRDDPKCSGGAGCEAFAMKWNEIPTRYAGDQKKIDALQSTLFRVGIDPNGGDDPLSPDIVWSDEWAIYNAFAPVAVEAKAQSDTITVFTMAMNRWMTKHNDRYMTRLSLTEVGSVAPPSVTPPPISPSPADGLKRSPASVHLIGDNGFLDMVKKLKAQGVSVTGVKACVSIGVLKDVKAIDPNIVTLGRLMKGVHSDVNVEGPSFTGDLKVEAMRVMNSLLPAWEQHRSYVDIWEVINEQDPIGPDGHKRMADFFHYLLNIAEPEGYRIAALSYSMGVPEYNEMEAVASTGLLRRLKENNHGLALHEYASPMNRYFGDAIPGATANPFRGPLAFRYRFWEDFVGGPDGMPDVYLTEVNVAQKLTEMDSEDWYNQMLWYMEGVAQDPYVKMANIFTLGRLGDAWKSFDISLEPYRSQYMRLVLATAGKQEAPQPPVIIEPTPLPVEPYDKTYNVVEADIPIERRKAIYARCADLQQTVGPAATDAVAWAKELLDAGKSVTMVVWDRKPEDYQRWRDWAANIDSRIVVVFEGPGEGQGSGSSGVPWDRDISMKLSRRTDYQNFTDPEIKGRGWQKSLSEVTGVTIHHHGSLGTPEATARDHTNRDGGTPSIHYHIWIERDGTVFLVAPIEERLWHDHNWDYAKHMNHNLAVVLNGALHKYPPTDAQLASLIKVLKWAVAHPEMRITKDNIKGHMDRKAITVCPGWLTAASGYWKNDFLRLWEGVPQKEVTGVHAAPILSAPACGMDTELLRLRSLRRKPRWYKQLYNGDPGVLTWIKRLKGEGIEPVIRMYAPGSHLPGRNPVVAAHIQSVVNAGAVYIEGMNEPNIEMANANWHDRNQVAALAASWWADAKAIIAAGGKAAFPAMAPTDRGAINQTVSGVAWAEQIFEWIGTRYLDEMRQYLKEGKIWLAVHVSPFNKPFDFNPQQPGYVDDFCLLYYEYLQELFRGCYGIVPITISTEGGVYSPKHMKDLTFPVVDGRVVSDYGLVLYDDATWGDYVWKLDDFLRQRGTLDGMCPWTFSDQGVHDTRWHGCGWYDINGHPRSPAA